MNFKQLRTINKLSAYLEVVDHSQLLVDALHTEALNALRSAGHSTPNHPNMLQVTGCAGIDFQILNESIVINYHEVIVDNTDVEQEYNLMTVVVELDEYDNAIAHIPSPN